MLAMYVHTHWGYNHPYAARTWTVEDWRGYLGAIRSLGYDAVMFWPLFDSMPPQPTESDRAFLARAAQAIQIAHREFGMQFLLTVGANVMGNDKAAKYAYEQRPYFVCERKVDPGDPVAVEAMLDARRWQFEPLAAADGMAMIDSDPGGYVGSTNEEFVNVMARQLAVFRQYNPKMELRYWVWVGWENYNRFWAQAQQGREGNAEPSLQLDPQVFTDTLDRVRVQIPEPWSLLLAWPEHLAATRQLGLVDKRCYIPYGYIEGEPTFPLTNYTPEALHAAFERYPDETFPRGVIGNCQTHCLQIPHTYLFAHYARGGSVADADLASLAEGLLPGLGAQIAVAWEAIGRGSPQAQRTAAQGIREQIGRSRAVGAYGGLLFGDGDRFLNDLAANLEIRAALANLGQAVADGGPAMIKTALRGVSQHLVPYQERLGFVDAYGGPLYYMLNEPLAKLHDSRLDEVLGQFHDWRNPALRNGVVPQLFAAIRRYVDA